MADQDLSMQNNLSFRRSSHRLVMLMISLIMIYAFAAIAYGQQPGEREPQNTPANAPATPQQPTINDRLSVPGQQPTNTPATPAVPGAQTPDRPATAETPAGEGDEGATKGENADAVNEGYTNPNLDADAERMARVRKKPEHAYYFIAQYATRYDDNVTFDIEDPRQDEVFLPQVGFGLVKVSARGSVRLDYRGGGEIYRKNSQLTGMLNAVNFGADYDLTRRTTVTIANYLVSRPNPTRLALLASGPALPNIGGTSQNAGALTLFTATRSTFNNTNVGLIHRLSRHSSIFATATYSFNRFSSPALLDSSEKTIEAGYSRQTSRTLSYDLVYRLSSFQSGGSSLSNSFLPVLTYSRQRMRIRGGVGPQYVTSPGLKGKLFWAAVADFSYSPSLKTTIAAAYTAGVGQGGGLGITRNHTFFGILTRRFGRWQTEFRSGYSSSRQADISSTTLLPAGVANKQLIIEGQVSYPIADKVAMFLDYSYQKQLGIDNPSGVSSNGSTRNIFSVGFNFDTRRTSRDRDLRVR